MKKTVLSLLCFITVVYGANAQATVAKLIGKKGAQTKLGYGVFGVADFPLNPDATQAVRIEILDFAYFATKNEQLYPGWGYLSIKAGYKHIFSETLTGFYVVPQAGWCRVVLVPEYGDATHRDGIATSVEGGYSLEVGRRANSFNFGLKLETNIAGKEYNLTSLAFRIAFIFSGRKRDW